MIIVLSTISTLKGIFRKLFWAAVTFLWFLLEVFLCFFYCDISVNTKRVRLVGVKRFVYFSYILLNLWMIGQGFIQAVLIMSVFEGRLRFRMSYFIKDENKIILQWMWRSRGTVIFVAGPWQSLSGGSGGKASERFYLFHKWKVNNSLKIERKYSKFIHLECTLEANLFLCALKPNFMKIEFQTHLEYWVFCTVYPTSKLLRYIPVGVYNTILHLENKKTRYL